MNTPIAVAIESARGEILNALGTIQAKYSLPPCIIDGILSSVQSDIRAQEKISIINATNAMLDEKEKELQKAKEEAKKTLRSETAEKPEE